MMPKQKYSVDFANPNPRKYKYSFNNNSYDLNVRASLDQKIGVTRVPQSSLLAIDEKYVSHHKDNNKPHNKIRSSAHFITFDSKSKRQAYSTGKLNSNIYSGNKFNSQIKLPSIKKSMNKFLQNPQSISQNESFFKLSPEKVLNKKVYYQSLVRKADVLTTNYLITLAGNHFLQTIQALKTGKHIKLPTPKHQIKLHKKSPKLKTVYLDLDETLVHCDENSNNYTVKLDFPVQGGYTISAGIRVRPYCKQFLEQLSTMAEIIIFTASSASYADVVLKYLDPHNKIFAHKLYRQHCTLQKGYYIKDLRTVNRRLQDVVLVDNSGYCFMLQPYNGIPIIPYYHYKKDTQLMNLIPFLKQVLKADDVRVPIKNTFFWNKYFQNDNDPRKIFQSNFLQGRQN